MIKGFFLTFIYLLINVSLNAHAGDNTVKNPYIYFKKNVINADWNSSYAHPMLSHHFGSHVFTYQRGNILRVAVYREDAEDPQRARARGIYDVCTDKTLGYYTGMPAEVIVSEGGGVRFADGSQPKDCLPPGTQPIGSDSWPYEMRWERVWKHYYDVTIYRTSSSIIRNALMTEKDSRYKELEQALGDSSFGKQLDRSFAAPLGYKTEIYQGFPTRSATDALTLVEVTEADLPPDFPKGLVRWEPRELPVEKKPDTP